MSIRGRKTQHHFCQCAGAGVALQITGESHMQTPEVEGCEQMQLQMLLDQELRLTFAEQLKCGAKPTSRPQRSLGDNALNSVLTSGEADDLRRLAIAESRQNDGRC